MTKLHICSHRATQGRPLCRLSTAGWLCTTAVKRACLPGFTSTMPGACPICLSGKPLTHAEVSCCCCWRLRFLPLGAYADGDAGCNMSVLTLHRLPNSFCTLTQHTQRKFHFQVALDADSICFHLKMELMLCMLCLRAEAVVVCVALP